jgi:hypothetical protein
MLIEKVVRMLGNDIVFMPQIGGAEANTVKFFYNERGYKAKSYYYGVGGSRAQVRSLIRSFKSFYSSLRLLFMSKERETTRLSTSIGSFTWIPIMGITMCFIRVNNSAIFDLQLLATSYYYLLHRNILCLVSNTPSFKQMNIIH